jgi:hypothetical protein
MHISRSGDDGLRRLAACADGSLGFQKMHTVYIDFAGNSCCGYEPYLRTMPVLELPTRSLTIKYLHENTRYDTPPDPLEMPVLEKLAVRADGKQAQVKWKRNYEAVEIRGRSVLVLKEGVDYSSPNITERVVWV